MQNSIIKALLQNIHLESIYNYLVKQVKNITDYKKINYNLEILLSKFRHQINVPNRT